MQYILSEEEYKQMMPLSEHQKIRNSLLDSIEKLEKENAILKVELIKGRPCYDRGNTDAYCDGCPLGFEHLKLCNAEHTNYSE